MELLDTAAALGMAAALGLSSPLLLLAWGAKMGPAGQNQARAIPSLPLLSQGDRLLDFSPLQASKGS